MKYRSRIMPLAILAALPFFVSLPEGGAAPKGPSISSAMWQAASNMSTPRRGHIAHFVPGVGLVVAGGYAEVSPNDTALQTAERLDLATGMWSPLSPPPNGIYDGRSAVLPDGRIFTIEAGSAATYNPAMDMWTDETALALNYQYSGVLGVLPNGDVISAGGGEGEDISNQSVRYDPVNHVVKISPKMKAFRSAHTGTSLPDGRFLVTGGWKWGSNDDGGEIHVTLSSAEVFDPATDTWTLVASMATDRKGHTAVNLSSGKVLVTGGIKEDQDGHLTASEIYDPATNTWTTVASMNEGRWHHRMTALPSGRIMVSGGSVLGSSTASVEVYDPDLNTWTTLPPMASLRAFHSATYVPGYGVVIAGGTPGNGSLSSVEIYPLGNAALGASCVIGDECVSGICEGGQCVEPGTGAGGAGGAGGEGGAGGAGGCSVQGAGSSDPAPMKLFGVLALGLLALRRRR